MTHIDGTARHQTVRRDDNRSFYELIDNFRMRSGVPLVLNTSLNGHDEPLVESPDDAKAFFDRTEVDMLVVNDRMIYREAGFEGQEKGAPLRKTRSGLSRKRFDESIVKVKRDTPTA